MSKELGKLKNTGSRNVDMSITRFWGGIKKGVCVQLTAQEEDGRSGYVQLSAQDIITLIPILKNEIIDMEAERKEKEADEIIKKNKELKKSIVSDMKNVSRYLIQFESFEIGNLLLFGNQEFEVGQNEE